jgi:peptidoglycan/xylan/chitin deacetylase (PgdA/CDA1 family)
VPAIFFIPSGLIDERQLGWWDQISYLLKRTRKRTIEVQDQTFALEDMNAAVRQLLGWMKLKPEDQTKELVEQLSAACEVPLPSAEERNAEIMGWDEIRRCPDSGIAIGSHTHSHRVLATLPSEQQATELSRSKELIESKIGRPVRSLAYPVGGRAHFTPTTEKLAKNAGYAVAFSFGGDDCINRWGAITPFDVRRFSPPDSLALLAATAAMPGLFARTWRLPFRG